MPTRKRITQIRDSVCAVLRLQQINQNQINLSIVGTAWCFVRNKFLITAHHVFNNGNPRNPADKFVILRAPNNGSRLERMPIVNFNLEDSQSDFAILEISDPTSASIELPALQISFDKVQDGVDVITYGCPSPEVSNASVVEGQINFNTNLVATANLGIVSAQVEDRNVPTYFFNVHWFNGESGGPILTTESLKVFAIMQMSKNISTPNGIIPGPRLGRSLLAIQDKIQALLPTEQAVTSR